VSTIFDLLLKSISEANSIIRRPSKSRLHGTCPYALGYGTRNVGLRSRRLVLEESLHLARSKGRRKFESSEFPNSGASAPCGPDPSTEGSAAARVRSARPASRRDGLKAWTTFLLAQARRRPARTGASQAVPPPQPHGGLPLGPSHSPAGGDPRRRPEVRGLRHRALRQMASRLGAAGQLGEPRTGRLRPLGQRPR